MFTLCCQAKSMCIYVLIATQRARRLLINVYTLTGTVQRFGKCANLQFCTALKGRSGLYHKDKAY